MPELHPINQALLTLLDNQMTRTEAVFEGLAAELFDVDPGGDCNSIRAICNHLVGLRRFQLTLLESPLAAQVDEPAPDDAPDAVLARLTAAAALVRRAIASHDPADWYAAPGKKRDGFWADDPTLLRFTRPFNDFTSHLGAIRAIRRILGHPAARTQ